MFDSPFSISNILGLPPKTPKDTPMTSSQSLDRHMSYKIPYNSETKTTAADVNLKKKVPASSSLSASRFVTNKLLINDLRVSKLTINVIFSVPKKMYCFFLNIVGL